MTSPLTDVTPNRRGARSREVVLDAAERVMAEHGYAGATMARIVEAAGVPASSIYHYFGSKDGVLLAVMERGADRFFAALPEPQQALGTAEEHLTALMDAVRRTLEANPDFLRLLVVMATQPPAVGSAEAHEVVLRVREVALVRLRKQFALIFGTRANSRRADRMARYALAVIDGAFVASQADDGVSLADFLDDLPATIIDMNARIA